MVTWDAAGVGLGGVDLTGGGVDNGIEMLLLAIDVGTVDLTISLVDTGSGTSSLMLSDLAVAGSLDFMFADFTGSADIADINAIFLTIDAGANTDLTLDGLSTAKIPQVPIPAAAWLFGSALLGLSVFKRKQLKA